MRPRIVLEEATLPIDGGPASERHSASYIGEHHRRVAMGRGSSRAEALEALY